MKCFKAICGIFLMLLGSVLVASFFDEYLAGIVGRKSVDVGCISLMSIGTFLIMPWLTQGFEGLFGVAVVVERLSMYSYSIYLSHYPLIFAFLYFFPVSLDTPAGDLFFIIMGWIFSVFFISALIYHGFEGPVANLRERFTKRVAASPF